MKGNKVLIGVATNGLRNVLNMFGEPFINSPDYFSITSNLSNQLTISKIPGTVT